MLLFFFPPSSLPILFFLVWKNVLKKKSISSREPGIHVLVAFRDWEGLPVWCRQQDLHRHRQLSCGHAVLWALLRHDRCCHWRLVHLRVRCEFAETLVPFDGFHISSPSAGCWTMAAAVPSTRTLWPSSSWTTPPCFIWNRSQSSSRSFVSSERRVLRGKVCNLAQCKCFVF